ncbi:MAG: hypothetical protein JWN72_2965 [Thermoleophilia bacterium]|nr:hypothetical protein [Thermoleophilia bacterium]
MSGVQAGATSMAGMTMTSTATTAATGAAATAPAVAGHSGHIAPKAPVSGDPRFVDGSTGAVGQAKTIKQKDGPAYGGEPVKKNQNGNDKKQQNYGVTDANFMEELGVIADPDTGQPQSYAQTMQTYNATGALEALYPTTFAKLVANQNAGKGTVQGAALAIFGITKTDGANGASLAGVSDQEIGTIRTAQLGNLGSLKDYVLDTQDFKGREWNRAHHSLSAWTGMTNLVDTGYQWNEAALLTGDSMTSWSGRVIGSNNQDGSETGFAADELAGLKYTVLMEQATGKPALEGILASHAATHLPEDKLTDPKINKFIGLPKDYRPKTDEDRAMVAARIRAWALDPNVQVDEGEFNKFVQAGNKTAAGAALSNSGLLGNVQFKAKQQHQHTEAQQAAGDANAADTEALVPTALGTGTIEATGGGAAEEPTAASTLLPLTGSNTIDTRPTLANLGATGPYDVLDEATGKLSKTLQDQLMTAFLETLYQMSDSALLGDKEERDAFVDGAKKGVKMVKGEVAADPKAVKALKAEVKAALADGTISPEERTSLAAKLGDAGMEDLAAAIKDGKPISEKDLAVFDEKIDGAVSQKLEDDIAKALEDGTVTAEERATFEGRLGAGGLDKLDAAVKDGKVTKEELTGISDAVKQDGVDPKSLKDTKPAEGTAAEQAAAAKAKADGTTPKATDAKAGADAAAGGATADDKAPKLGAEGAAAGAEAVSPPAAGGTKAATDAPKAATDAPKATADAPKATAAA